jgi:hypothetical protein
MGWKYRVGCVCGLLAGTGVTPALAQGRGSTAAAVAGGARGSVSGATLAVAGALIPCTQTLDGATCILGHALAGGTLGLVGGALAGRANDERVHSAGLSAGIGFLAGSAVGLVLKPVAQRFGWHDVLTIGLLGAAIGASPEGAAVGLGGGAVAGLIVWKIAPGGTFPDGLAMALAGIALGGISGWLVTGLQDESSTARGLPLPLGRIRF